MSLQLHTVYVYYLCQSDVSARYQDSVPLRSDLILMLQTEHDTPGSSIFTRAVLRKYMHYPFVLVLSGFQTFEVEAT